MAHGLQPVLKGRAVTNAAAHARPERPMSETQEAARTLRPMLIGDQRWGRGPRAVALMLALVASQGVACKPSGGGPAPSPSGSAQAAPSPSGSAEATPPAGEPSDAAPTGTGVASFTSLAGKADCQPQTSELAAYLQRGEIALAARDGGISTSWMVQLPNKTEAQVAFGGYDGQAKQVARVRGIGTSEQGAKVFATGTKWTVTWFDADGLAYIRPPWEMGSAPTLEHLGAVKKSMVEDVALAATPAGSVVAVTPFGPENNQLGIFLFGPTDPAAPPVQALGVSRQAGRPRRPAVAADESGYYVAWFGEGESIVASHFDVKGKEADELRSIAPAGPKREDLSLVATPSGALALWLEGDTIVARALSKQARPTSAPVVVAKGARWPDIVPMGDGALVVWIGKEGKSDGQLLSVKISATGAPSEKGLVLSDEGHSVKDAPAVGVAGSRAAYAWTEVMSATVSTKRALLRTIEVACLP